MIDQHFFNIEIKAKCENLDEIRHILQKEKAEFIGTDYQKDTYFKVEAGRLKLREGNIENSLIYYDRGDKSGPKKSDVILYQTENSKVLSQILKKVANIFAIVEKRREIYYIENVKIHLDIITELGTFVEVEAIQSEKYNTYNKLENQCKQFMELLKIKSENLISDSYSDLVNNL